MPGGIDPHVHLHHVWIKPDGTPLITAGPEQVGRAALYGGTTTFIDFAYWRDGVSAQQAVETRDKDFVGKSPCDWAYHIMLHSEPPPEFAGQLAEAIQAGYPTLKIFTTNILPSRTGRMITQFEASTRRRQPHPLSQLRRPNVRSGSFVEDDAQQRPVDFEGMPTVVLDEAKLLEFVQKEIDS